MARTKQLIPKRIGKAVRKARGGESLRSYAKKLGVSHSHLFQVENGDTRPTMDRLHRWCKVTGLGAEVFYPELRTLVSYIAA